MKLFFAFLIAASSVFAQPAVWDTFGGGKAEVSSYSVVQPRYGELRPGTTVMVFVTEDIHEKTRIKIENPKLTPANKRVPVIKLNRTLKFTTGIYDYSVMTSVFTDLRMKDKDYPLNPLKISLIASEWCGNFYAHLLPFGAGARLEMHSYFENEGDKKVKLSVSGPHFYEDNLPIRIRELMGPWMKDGQTLKAKFLPSIWDSRTTHKPLAWQDGTITKSENQTVIINKQKQPATRWQWMLDNRKTTYWVDQQYPHYILKWETSKGEKGERLATLHTPYWNQHANKDESLREQLKLP